jgi:hypothetical protein
MNKGSPAGRVEAASARVAGCVRWPGISVACGDLKVSRMHLYRVLSGRSPDRRGFRERYAAWKRQHGL